MTRWRTVVPCRVSPADPALLGPACASSQRGTWSTRAP